MREKSFKSLMIMILQPITLRSRLSPSVSCLFQNVVLLTFFFAVCSPDAQAQLTQSSLTLNFDANQDQSDNGRWESTLAGSPLDLRLDPSVLRSTGTLTSGFAGITQTYSFIGSGTTEADNTLGAEFSLPGDGSNQSSLTNIAGDPTNNSASWEMWFRPSSLNTAGKSQVLFEDGGGTGIGLYVQNGVLSVKKLPTQAIISFDLSTLTTGDFVQAAWSYDTTTNELKLYVNGASVGSPVVSAGGDWSGSDPAALGTRGGLNMGGVGSGSLGVTSFEGDISVFRFYETTLSAADVSANYNAVTASTVFFDNDSASGLWGTDVNWDTNIQPTSAQDVVINNGASVTVTLAGETANTLTIGSTTSSTFVPAVTSGAGTLTLTGGDLTVSGTLTLGDGQDGTLVLSGGTLNANGGIAAGSAISTLTLNGGTLNMNGNAIGSGAAPIANLTFGAGTLDSVLEINGGTGLAKTTPGTLTLMGTNTYSGGTIVNGGTLAVGSTDALPVGGAVTVNTGGTLDLPGFNAAVGQVTLAGGTISGTGVLSSAGNFDLQSGSVSGILGGSATLTKSSSGVITLSAANTFTGATTVSGGTLVAGHVSALSTSSGVSVSSGGRLISFTGAGSVTTPYSVAVTGLTLADGSSVGGELGGGFSTGTATAAGTINVDVYGSPALANPGGTTFTLLTATSGLSGATAYQIGNVFNNTNFTVSNANLTTSDTQIQVTPQAATALTAAYWKGGFAGGSNVWAVSDGSTLSNWASDAGGTDTGLVPGAGAAIIISATSATNQSGMVLGADMTIDTLTITDTTTTSLNADGHTLTIANSLGSTGIAIDAAAGAATINADLVLGGVTPTITHDGANDLILGGVISGSAGLIKAGAGTLILTADNTYTGDTNINSGTLQVGDGGTAGTLGDTLGTINVGNATLLLNRADGVTIADDLNFTIAGGVLRAMTGTNFINGGTVGNLDAIVNVTWTVDSGAVLTIGKNGAADNIGMSGNILTLDGEGYGVITRSLASGGGGGANLVKNGTGTWELANSATVGTNKYSGYTEVNGGILLLNSTTGNALDGTSWLTVNNGTVLLGRNNQIADAVPVTITGSTAVLDLGTNHTDRVGTFTLANGGTITGAGTSALTVNAGSTFELKDGTVSVSLAGSAGLNKTSAGTVTINAAATYTGGTNVAGGTLLLDLAANNTGMINGSSGLTMSGGRLLIQGQSGGGNVSSETMGNLTLAANTSSIIALDSNTGDSTTLILGSVWDRGTNSFLVINYTAASSASFVNTGSGVTGSGAMTGGVFSYAIVKDATGTGFATTDGSFNLVRDTNVTVLSATNSDATSGGVNFTSTAADPDYSAGTLTLTSASPHLVNTLVIDATGDGTLDLNGGAMTFTQNALVVTGSGGFTIQNGQLGGSNLDLTVFTDASGILTLNTSIGGGIGGLIKQGGGTALLTGSSDYTGSTIIGGGTLAVGSTTALSPTTAVILSDVVNTNLDISGFDTTIGSLSGGGSEGGNVILGANTLTVGADNTSATYDGVISGTGQLVKTGDGTLTLTRASTFTGNATVSQGIVNLQAGNGLGATSITVNDGATLQLQGGITVNTGILTLNSGAATGQNGGLVNVSGSNIYNRQITIAGSATAIIAADAGTLTLDNGTTTAIAMAANQLTLLSASGAAINVGTGVGNENIGMGNSILILDGAGNGNIKSFIASGNAAGILIKNGSGTWTLSRGYAGNNGWSAIAGNTAHVQINEGTLKMAATDAISYGSGKGNVQVNSGGTLDLAGRGTNINGLENLPGNTTGIVTNSSATGSTLTIGNGDASAVFRGIIQNGTGAIAVTKIGTGTQSLIGTNTFTGATTVTGGTLIMSANSSSLLTIGSGATFHYVSGTGSGATMNVTSLSLDDGSTFGTELGSTIAASGAVTVTTSAAVTVDVFGIPGTSPTGTITLASATGGFTATGATYTLGKVFNATNFTVGTVNATDTDVSIDVASATPLTTAYWAGGFSGDPNLWSVSNGSSSNPMSNWATDQNGTGLTALVPGAGTEVILSSDVATNQATMALGANMSIDRLTINDTATTTLNADGYSLTINNSSSGTGIAMSSGAGAAALNSSVILSGTSPTITIDSTTNALTMGGEISGSAGVTKEGVGRLIFTAANSYAGGTNINNGALQIGNGGATGSVGAGAIIGSGTATLAVNRSGTVTFNDTISVPNLELVAGTTRITADTTVSTSFISASGALLETTGNITLDLSTATAVSNSGGINVVSDTLTIKPTTVSQLPAASTASFYYSFDNSADVFNDDSGVIVYDGVKGNAGALPTYTADGKFGGAVTFNGTNQGFQASGAQDTILQNAESVLTYASWIKIDPTQTGTTLIFEEGGSTNGLTLWTDGGSMNARIQNNGGTGPGVTVSAADVLTDGWHHIAVSYSDSTIHLYVDGVELDSKLFAASLNAHSDNSGIGYLEASSPVIVDNNFFKGAMDEVYYFDDAGLNSSQIASLANGMSVTSLGALSLNDGATINIDGSAVGSAATLFGPVTSNGDATITGTGKLIGTTFNVDTGKTLTVNNEVTGVVGLKVAGPGTVVLTGTNTYSGVTQITGGTLSISSDDNLGAVPASAENNVILNGGTLRTTTDMALSANRGITVGASGGGIETSAGTTLTMNDTISGTGGLTKSGDGVFLVATDNSATHTGATQINAGTVQLASGAATGSGDVILHGATAALAGTGTVAGNTVVLAGTLLPGDPGVFSGIGTLTIAADATFTNGATLDLQFTHANGLGSSATSNLDGAGDLDWAAITAASRNAGSADLLDVAGLLTLNTDASIKLSTPDSGTFEKGMAWDLVDWGTLGAAPASLTFDVDSALSLDLATLGLALDTSHFATNGIIAIVPEPSRMGLLACGIAAALIRRRRRDLSGAVTKSRREATWIR